MCMFCLFFFSVLIQQLSCACISFQSIVSNRARMLLSCYVSTGGFFSSICSPNGKERCECIKYAVGYFCQFGECIFFKMLYVDFGCKLFVFFSLFKKFLSLIKRKKTHRMTYLQMVSLSKKRKNGEKKRATDSLAYPGHSCVEYYERTTE